jgi:hypothetical protein
VMTTVLPFMVACTLGDLPYLGCSAGASAG